MCTWHTETQIIPVSISIGILWDFLLHLYESLYLAASTLCAYKAVILSALTLRQISTPAQLGTLTKLCNVFHKRRPPKPSVNPTWDIGLVLRAFSLASFEPLETATLEAITYKTFVLIALSLGTHRGEHCTLRRGRSLSSGRLKDLLIALALGARRGELCALCLGRSLSSGRLKDLIYKHLVYRIFR